MRVLYSRAPRLLPLGVAVTVLESAALVLVSSTGSARFAVWVGITDSTAAAFVELSSPILSIT